MRHKWDQMRHSWVIWESGKFGLKKGTGVDPRPPLVDNVPFFYRFFLMRASLSLVIKSAKSKIPIGLSEYKIPKKRSSCFENERITETHWPAFCISCTARVRGSRRCCALLGGSWSTSQVQGNRPRDSCLHSTEQRSNTLMWPSLRQRRQTSGSGQSDAMCPYVELHL